MNKLEEFKNNNLNRLKNGVYYLSENPNDGTFEDVYIKLRQAESRVYDDNTVKKLPDINKNHVNYKEWSIRKNSTDKLVKYISELDKELNILELGSGNGWLSNKLSEVNYASVWGVDINTTELEQAAHVFGNKENLVFAYDDIFESKITEIKFDIIILAGVLMYFEDLNKLIDKLLGQLNASGEIHIIDNAFYNENNIASAKERTLEHYKQIGVPGAEGIIYHHLLSGLDKLNPQIIYNPNKLINKFRRKFLDTSLSPLYWMKIVGS